MNNYMGDLISVEAADGLGLFMPDERRCFPVYGNFGTPPITYITSRGYRQHGATFLDYVIEPRTVTMGFYEGGINDRAVYWKRREELINLLRPNRGGPVTLTIVFPDQRARALKVYPDPGFVFPPQPIDRNNWGIEEQLTLTAFNPFWYDPTPTVLGGDPLPATGLEFPIEFPIVFGYPGKTFRWQVAYEGSWHSYPTITLNGAFTRADIVNETTGISMVMSRPVGASEQRIISLEPGNHRITDGDGVNKFSELSEGSNLTLWRIEPDPIVTGGVQYLRVSLYSSSDEAGAEIQYYTNYLGI